MKKIIFLFLLVGLSFSTITKAQYSPQVVTGFVQPYNSYIKTALDTNGRNISSSGCSIYSFNFINTTSTTVFVELYNIGNPTSLTIPFQTLAVPSSGTVVAFSGISPLFTLISALGIRCSTSAWPNATGEPTTTTANQVSVYINYK